MPVLDAFDAFLGTDGQNLTARDWAKQAGGGDVILSTGLTGPNRRARANTNSACRYLKVETPSQAEHTVGSQWLKRSGHGQGGLMVRGASGADTAYVFEHVHNSGLLRLLRVVAGSTSVLASAAHTWAADTSRSLWLKARTRNGGSVVRVTGTLRENGNPPVVLTSDDSAASRITATGQAGLRITPGTGTLLEQRSYQCERWWLASVDADARPRADKPAAGPLALRVLGKVAAERAAERRAIAAEALTAAGGIGTWQASGHTLAVPGGVTVGADAIYAPLVTIDGALPFPEGDIRWPIRIPAPGVLVPDGTVREAEDEAGRPVLLPNDQEDALAHLRRTLAGVLVTHGALPA